MIIIDNPYVSDFLLDTIHKNEFYVLKNEFSKQFEHRIGNLLLTELEFISKFQNMDNPRIYSNSENAIGWISKHLKNEDLAISINRFKDKVLFRKFIEPLYPDFFFKEAKVEEINSISIDNFPTPFIIKPAVGFFSLGVHKVNHKKDWPKARSEILSEINSIKHIYPKEVLDIKTFIIEACIEGDEFAFDAYYNEYGKPEILGIFKHYFGSKNDVNDRMYYTSKNIMKNHYTPFLNFLEEMGALGNIKNFPLHIEVRVSNEGSIIPIEVNPLRFGGWCTTADSTYHAYGINPYNCFLKNTKPNWNTILSQCDEDFFSIIVLDNTTGVNNTLIKSFNYHALNSKFSNVLELRKVDHKSYGVFGFLFTKTPHEKFSELNRIATSSLKEFITT